MPEYLAPGVFVEETSFRQKTIEGVSTSTTGFVGPTRFGPTSGEPPLLTSFADFERIYGGLDRLQFGTEYAHNYVAHAVRSYFEEGGKRLFVARVYKQEAEEKNGVAFIASQASQGSPSMSIFTLRARHPGAAGNFRVRMILELGDNVLSDPPGSPTQKEIQGGGRFDVVLAFDPGSPAPFRICYLDLPEGAAPGETKLELKSQGSPPPDLQELEELRVLTVSVAIGARGRFDHEELWEDLRFHPDHREAISRQFASGEPVRRSTHLYVPLVLDWNGTNGADGLRLAEAFLAEAGLADSSGGDPLAGAIEKLRKDDSLVFSMLLTGGSDGADPEPGDYEGTEAGQKSGLKSFEDLEDISIVAAPGSTKDAKAGEARAVASALISHCERMRYRVAVLDSIEKKTMGEVREYKAQIDSTHAAFYFPWIRINDPVTETEILVPPSGSMAGIYARNDVDRGVHKSPANEVIRQALGFEMLVNKAQQETLNPRGINCLRYFEGRGYRVWGARTTSSDPEWKYLNVRRYFAYLERSIEKGTQWVVFENNGPVLWANVRRTIEDFVFNEWKENHLLGTRPEEAFFVRCDRETMTQNDLDNGRLVCLIGVAPLKPAEFVIFRIGQKTAESR